MKLYEVTSPSGSTCKVQAIDATQAKRQVCRWIGVSPSDPWGGMKSMTAREIPEENPETTTNNNGVQLDMFTEK
jgi:hypothetical protein